MSTSKDIQLPTRSLQKVADKMGCAFSTVSKAYSANSKNWRNCTVRGVRVRDELRKEMK